MRQMLVAGNWKMHGSRVSVEALLGGLIAGLAPKAGTDVVVCPTYVHLEQALQQCAGSSIEVGGQDCSHMESGAFTGEVAAQMLADLGCLWVILGHSERRQYHEESDELVAAKLTAAVAAGLQPVVCVGETREQRESGEAQDVVGSQLSGALAGQSGLERLVVAYEPVWAIGTGETATPKDASEAHATLRGALAEALGPETARGVPLLYGGSVKPGNATELLAASDVDGVLVGGASLDPGSFAQIGGAAG